MRGGGRRKRGGKRGGGGEMCLHAQVETDQCIRKETKRLVQR